MPFDDAIVGKELLRDDRRQGQAAADRMAALHEAKQRYPAVLRSEAYRLGVPEDFDPVADPDKTADWLEGQYGTLDKLPGYYNASEFRDKTEAWANKPAVSDQNRGERYLRSQHLLPGLHLEYMQQGPGRAIDLLRGLKADPAEAMSYWDKSNRAETSRDLNHEANFQRYSGYDKSAQEFVTNPLNVVASHLHNVNTVPNAIAFGAEQGIDPIDLESRLAAAQDLYNHQRNFRLGEIPIMNVPAPKPGATDQELSEAQKAYFDRAQQAARLAKDLLPPPDQNVANAWSQGVFGVNASPFVSDAMSVARNAVDPSLVGGMFMDVLRGLSGGNIAKLVAKEAVNQAKGELPLPLAASIPRAVEPSSPEQWLQYFFHGAPSVPLDYPARARARNEMWQMQQNPQSIWEERARQTIPSRQPAQPMPPSVRAGY